MPTCLSDKLIDNIRLFDAIEYSHFYTKQLNLNNKALKISKKYNLPLIANSDAHTIQQFGKNYSLIDCNLNYDSLFDSIKKNKIQIVSKPLNYSYLLKQIGKMIFE